MSGLYENQKTLRALRARIDELKPRDNENFYFVLGWPRSDIGKGTLTAQLLAVVEDSDAIKFDGLLNTNENGRHTARGHDDFGIYEKFNPSREFGREHYLLGGELYRDFIAEFGENENLQIAPHFSYFVEAKILEMWRACGAHKNLFIEVGGLISDPEVGPVFMGIISRMTEEFGAKTILLTELGWNDEYIKTKTVQEAVSQLLSQNLKPWTIFVREPKNLKPTESQRLEFERVVSRKLFNGLNFRASRIISVPNFADLHDYQKFIAQRFLPFILAPKKDEIFIATGNAAKLADYRLYLGDKFTMSSTKDLPKDDRLEIPEGVDSVEDNAIAKARAYAIKTGKVALGDDTGFFIDALNGEPGVALRRWGGELGESATQEQFWHYLQEKTRDLKNLDCYFKQCVAIVSPAGEMRVIYNINQGSLSASKLTREYNGSDYPLAAVFESKNRAKVWDDMTDAEKRAFDADFINELVSAIESL